jgi:hypothetical protein
MIQMEPPTWPTSVNTKKTMSSGSSAGTDRARQRQSDADEVQGDNDENDADTLRLRLGAICHAREFGATARRSPQRRASARRIG